MHIAMLSTPFLPVPPPRYGGTELIVAELVDGLRALGHRVTLYTVGGGPEHRGHALRDGARVRRAEPAWPPNPYHELDHAAWAIADLLAQDDPIDVIHTHCPTTLPLAPFAPAPLVYTIHHARDESLSSFYALQRGARFVAISERQRELVPEIEPHAHVVHHGLAAARYPLGRGGPHAVFLGRLAREKGPHVAIDVARAAAVPLRLGGRPHHPDGEYYASEIVPRLRGGGVEAVGEVDHARKVPLLGSARATLFPIDWEEPFGLVMIESMLCGTPVLAFARGAVPEVIDEGVTGFLCDGPEEMARRLAGLDGRFDRARCRARAAERFGRERMVRDYLAIYERARAERLPSRTAHDAEAAHGG